MTMTDPLHPVPLIVQLSRYNEFIDFQKVRQAGIQEAILCAGYGRMADPYFAYNWREFRAIGVKVSGFWEYSPYEFDDIQARSCMAQLYAVRYDPGESAFWTAVEIPGTLVQADYSEACRLFTMAVRQTAAPNIGIYTSKSKWDQLMGTHGGWGGLYPLYVAHYNQVVTQPAVPGPWVKRGWDYWQYVELNSNIPGIKGKITLHRVRP
jgi:GH25 family lysozyme M1 (1,4-beta-N-acetylmuramidase)